MKTPGSLTIFAGDLKIILASAYFWNLNGVWFQNIYTGQYEMGFWGTVLKYKNLGWVGTGHLENKIGEKILNLEFYRDGEKWLPDAEAINCKFFRMYKRSVVHKAELEYELELKNNALHENVKIRFLQDSDMDIIYHFMHNWDKAFTEYRVRSRKGKEAAGSMLTRNKGEQLYFDEPYAASLFAPEYGAALVQKVRIVKPLAKDVWRFWNRGDQDRKIYYTAGEKLRILQGAEGEWKMETRFYRMDINQWKKMVLK